MTPDDFISAVAPAAVLSAAASGVPASFTIAEGALESGWGDHAPGNNLFGVKADKSWRGDVVAKRTREFLNGQWVVVPAMFRSYPTWQGCMDDHAAFLRGNPRYAAAFACADGESFAQAVAAAGYATDPKYASEVITIMRAHNLAQYDAKAA